MFKIFYECKPFQFQKPKPVLQSFAFAAEQDSFLAHLTRIYHHLWFYFLGEKFTVIEGDQSELFYHVLYLFIVSSVTANSFTVGAWSRVRRRICLDQAVQITNETV